MGWNFYNASGELQINDGGVQAASAVFTGNVDLGSNLLVGNAGSTGIAISANGEVTMAAQPATLHTMGTTVDNVSGDGTTYTVIFDTEEYDQNADSDGTTFTAPVTGRYIVNAQLVCVGITAVGANCQMIFDASNRDFYSVRHRWGVFHTAEAGGVGMSCDMDMDANDTVTVQLQAFAEGSDIIDVSGTSIEYTYVSIRLAV